MALMVDRHLTSTFAGIRPVDTAAFIGAQAAGAIAGVLLSAWLS